MSNWWDEAPLAETKQTEQNWWDEAPVVNNTSTRQSRPVLVVPKEEAQYNYSKEVRSEVPVEAPMGDSMGMGGVYEPNESTYTKTEIVPATGNINDVLKDVLDEKGDITTAAYDNLTYEQALKVYEGLANHPESKIDKGQFGQDIVVFRGYKVPFPEPATFGKDAKIRNSTLMQDGIVDGLTNLAQFILSGVDKVYGTKLNESLDFPEVKTGSIGDSLAKNVAPIFVGSAGGLKLGSMAAKGIGSLTTPVISTITSKLPFLTKPLSAIGTVSTGAARATGLNLGVVSAIDEDTSGVFAGEAPMIKEMIQTFGMDENGKFNPDTFDKKMNLAIDAFAIDALIGIPAAIIAKIGKFAWETTGRPLASYTSQEVLEREAAQSYLQSLGLPENAIQEERLAFVQKLDRVIAENQNSYVGTGPKLIEGSSSYIRKNLNPSQNNNKTDLIPTNNNSRSKEDLDVFLTKAAMQQETRTLSKDFKSLEDLSGVIENLVNYPLVQASVKKLDEALSTRDVVQIESATQQLMNHIDNYPTGSMEEVENIATDAVIFLSRLGDLPPETLRAVKTEYQQNFADFKNQPIELLEDWRQAALKSTGNDGWQRSPTTMRALEDAIDEIRLGGVTVQEGAGSSKALISKYARRAQLDDEEFGRISDISSANNNVGSSSMGPMAPNVKIDPLAAIAEGTKVSDPVLSQQARTTRNDMFGSSLPEPEIKQRSYTEDVVDPFREELYTRGGGSESVEAARSGLVRGMNNELSSVQNTSTQARTAATDATLADNTLNTDSMVKADSAIESANQNYAERIRTDINFGADITKLEKKTDINVYRGPNQESDDIARNAQAAEQKMYDERNALYNDLPDGVELPDKNSWDNLIYKQNPETGVIDEEKFADGLTTKMKEIIKEANGDFKILHNKLVPELTAAIQKRGAYSDGLQDIKDNLLDEQLNDLFDMEDVVGDELIEKLLEARNYNMEYQKFFGKGSPLEGIKKANQTRTLAEVNPGVAQQNFVKTRDELETKVLTGNNNRETTGTFVELLNRPEAAGSDPKQILKYRIGKIVADKLRPKLANGTIDDLDVEDLVSAMKNETPMMETNFPDEYGQFQKLIDDLTALKGRISTEKGNKAKLTQSNINDLTKFANEAEAEAEKASALINQDLKRFMDGGFEKSEGQEILEGLYYKPEDINETRRAIERAKKSGDPKILAGMQSAFAKNLPLDPEKFSKMDGRTLKIAEELYAGDPDIVASIKEVVRILKITEIGKGSRASSEAAGIALDKSAAQAAGRVITMIWGVLNPTATKIRNVANVLGQKYSPREGLVRIVGEMAANPDEFRRIMKKYNSAPVLGRNAGIFISLARRAGIYSGQDETSAREYIESVLMDQEAETPSQNKSTDKQTEEMFGGQ